jgi:hypothetical protein
MGGAAGGDEDDVNGLTLTVNNPANAILSSGPLTYPSNKPIGAVFNHKSRGKLLVFGSNDMLTDDYFELEENQKLFVLKMIDLGLLFEIFLDQ